jgi:hypothetical protein
VLELDAPARSYIDALSEREEQQLRQWLETQPQIVRALADLGVAA